MKKIPKKDTVVPPIRGHQISSSECNLWSANGQGFRGLVGSHVEWIWLWCWMISSSVCRRKELDGCRFYVKKTFWIGMFTIGRSESVECEEFIDKYMYPSQHWSSSSSNTTMHFSINVRKKAMMTTSSSVIQFLVCLIMTLKTISVCLQEHKVPGGLRGA